MIFAGLIDVIHWLEDVFERVRLQRSYGGAIAYNYYGPPRLTQDVDVLAVIPDMKISQFVEELRSAGCQHLRQDLGPVELPAVCRTFVAKVAWLCSSAKEFAPSF